MSMCRNSNKVNRQVGNRGHPLRLGTMKGRGYKRKAGIFTCETVNVVYSVKPWFWNTCIIRQISSQMVYVEYVFNI